MQPREISGAIKSGYWTSKSPLSLEALDSGSGTDAGADLFAKRQIVVPGHYAAAVSVTTEVEP